MSRYRARFEDPAGVRYGLPTFPWRCAPDGLATKRQLTALGLRPGGQPPAAQVMWRSRLTPTGRPGDRTALLYRTDQATPKRAPTAGNLRAVAAMLAARRICPTCRHDRGYQPSRRLGCCNECAEALEVAA